MKQFMLPSKLIRSAAATPDLVPVGSCRISDPLTLDIYLPVGKCHNNVGYYFNYAWRPRLTDLSYLRGQGAVGTAGCVCIPAALPPAEAAPRVPRLPAWEVLRASQDGVTVAAPCLLRGPGR